MTQSIILNSSQKLTEVNTDLELADKLTESWFWLQDTIDEMVNLMADAKEHRSVEALKVRMEIIKHAQALHWSKASKNNLNVWIFMHPAPWTKLNY